MARPCKPPSERHENRLAIYLDDEDHAALLQMAARKGLATGVLARALLKEKLEVVLSEMACKGKTSLLGIRRD